MRRETCRSAGDRRSLPVTGALYESGVHSGGLVQAENLKYFPEKERSLWRVFDATPFECTLAVENASVEDVLFLLDYPSYFDLLEIPLPDGHAVILEALARDELICPCETGGWNITNLGAVLFAKKLDSFPRLKRKAGAPPGALRCGGEEHGGRFEVYRRGRGRRGNQALR